MILIDTNLWLYASLQESPQHNQAKAWLETTFNGNEAIALPWSVLRLLIQEAGTAGNLTSDAHLAALAIEHDCTLCSVDSDFRRFPGLRVRNPLTSP
ncbi:hypothetical protein KBY96_12550 [Cyanobium sp. ATX 6A2]|uniref:hypothetical protein n=1 Tax=Cyanobium sp. ATX 6A2 TaxID=2823700 RepID=UPI0020CD3C89|nr:hypothetical protein [Cyanobium sp. ATX 6A2]MCP9888753.1 hypothetical protein [Cyanobium sp. ATX 6A2]